MSWLFSQALDFKTLHDNMNTWNTKHAASVRRTLQLIAFTKEPQEGRGIRRASNVNGRWLAIGTDATETRLLRNIKSGEKTIGEKSCLTGKKTVERTTTRKLGANTKSENISSTLCMRSNPGRAASAFQSFHSTRRNSHLTSIIATKLEKFVDYCAENAIRFWGTTTTILTRCKGQPTI
jgi:hypothetical protein